MTLDEAISEAMSNLTNDTIRQILDVTSTNTNIHLEHKTKLLGQNLDNSVFVVIKHATVYVTYDFTYNSIRRP